MTTDEKQDRERDAAQPPKPGECVCPINVDGKHNDGCPRAGKPR